MIKISIKLPTRLTRILHRARRVKRRLAAFALIILVVLTPVVMYIIANTKAAEAAWWNDNWAYRKPIPIATHTAAENNVYIGDSQELSSTDYAGGNNTQDVHTIKVDSDSVAVIYDDTTSSLGKFSVYNTTTGTQERIPTTVTGAVNPISINAVMMDSDSIAIAYGDLTGSRCYLTTYNTTTGVQELVSTSINGNASCLGISISAVDSNSAVIAYSDFGSTRGEFSVFNTATGAQELAPTVFLNTATNPTDNYMLDSDSVVIAFHDVSGNLGKFAVYNTTSGANELTTTTFSGANDIGNVSIKQLDSNSAVISYGDATAVAEKFTVFNTTSGASELAAVTIQSGDMLTMDSAMIDSDSVFIAYYNNTLSKGKYVEYNTTSGTLEYGPANYTGSDTGNTPDIALMDSDSVAIAYKNKFVTYNVNGLTVDTSDLSKVQSDCGDIRFTDSVGNILPYYIVSGCGTASTLFHIFMDSFPAGAQSIYVYYGNPSASNGFSSSDFATAATGVTYGTIGSEENAPLSAAYWKFDEGYGTAAFDSASATASATLVNMDSPASTRSGWMTENFCVSNKCIKFPGGASGSVTVSKPYTNIKTVAFWVKPASSSAALLTLDGGSKSITASSGTISANNFSSPTIYVNGVQASTLTANTWNYVVVTTATGITAPTIKIGNVKGDFLSGFMDEVKLYSTVRDASQVKVDYNSIGGNGGGGSNVLGASDNNPALSNGLLGYWTMNESDGPANDSSGNGNNLTNNSGTTFAAGKFANAGNFVAASTDYFSSPSTINGVKTVAFWAKPTATTDEFINLVNSTAYITASSGTVTGTGFTNPTVYVNGVKDGTITANVWNHIVVTSDTAINAANFEVGRGNGAYNNGLIDDTRLYNRVLSGNEVANLYNWAPGPVAYWNFEEGQGTTVNDRTGNGNSGTWVGTLNSQWASGKYGKAGSYDNADNCVDNTSTTNFPTGDFTYTGWFYPNATSEGFDDYFNSTTSGNTDTFEVYADAGNLLHVTLAAGGMTMDSGSGTTTPGKWNYVTITRLGSTVTIYINGVAANTGTYGTALSAQSKFYTGGYQCGTDWYNGKIDEVKVYNYARTPGQITQDLNAGHPAPGSPVGSPLGYWKFDEGYGTTANNSGNGGSALKGTLTTMGTDPNGTSGWTQKGKFNKALEFDGSNDNVTIANSTALGITSDITISAWVKRRTFGYSAGILAKTDFVTNWDYDLYFDSGNRPAFYSDSIPASIQATRTVTDSAWHHIVFARTGSAYAFYIDGLPAGSGTNGSALGNHVLSAYIGKTESTNLFAGAIDEVKLFNFGLTSSQVQLEYNRGKNLVLGAMSDTSQLAGGSVASNSASAEFCVPGDSTSCASPVGRWNFEEGTGTTANDLSGNGLTGTLTNLPEWAAGKFGKGISFDGTDDIVSVSDNTLLEPTNDMTVQGWIKLKALPTVRAENAEIAYKRHSVSPFFSYALSVGSTGNLPVFGWTNNSGTWFFSNFTGDGLATGQWYFVTGVKSGGTMYVYVNGVNSSTTDSPTGTIFPSNLEFNIGASTNATDRSNAFIDEVRVYNYARTPAQIAWDYNKGLPIIHYKIDECQGTAINNSVASSSASVKAILNIGGGGSVTAVGTCNSPTDNTGAWYNGRSGKFNYSIDLDGTDDYISIPDNNVLRFNNSSADFSLFSWVKRTTTGTEYIMSKEDADNDGWRMMFNSSNQVVCSEDATDVTSSSGITDTNWHLIGCTIDRDGNGQVYIDGLANGTAVSMGTDPMVIGATAATIGTRSYSATNYFNGQIDDVRIYNYVLTPAQIRNVYNQNAAVRFGPLTGAP